MAEACHIENSSHCLQNLEITQYPKRLFRFNNDIFVILYLNHDSMRKLNNTEEEILKILWQLGKGFPKEILEKFKQPMPYNTFLSTIRKLEAEGFLAYNKFGRSHQYYPTISKLDYSKTLYKNLLSNFFGGSKEQLFSFFMEQENADPKEIEVLLKNFKNKK